MTEKSSDEILNELFHSLNLPPIHENSPEKKKRKMESSISVNSSIIDKNPEVNGSEKKQKKRHHKSKKKKKHKKKSKKDKLDNEEGKIKTEREVPSTENQVIETVESLKQVEQRDIETLGSNNNVSNAINSDLELNAGELPPTEHQDNDQLVLQSGSSTKEILIESVLVPKTEHEGKTESNELDSAVLINEQSEETNVSIDTIPLPIISVPSILVTDSVSKENSQVQNKGKSITIKNLKNSLVCTLAEESKNIQLEQKAIEANDTSTEVTKDSSASQENTITDTAKPVSIVESQTVKQKTKRKYRERHSRSSSGDRERKHKRRSRDRSRSHRRNSKERYSSHRDRSRSNSRSSRRYHSSSKYKSKSNYKSPSKSSRKSPSRTKHRSPSQSDSKSNSHRSFQKSRVHHLPEENSDTVLQERVKDGSPDCVDLLRDKATRKKLLEVAKKNAVYMMKNDHLNVNLGKELGNTAGKSVQELTNFCKQLAGKSDDDMSDEYDDCGSESESPVKAFSSARHPFLVKEKPIVMNIRNAPMIKPKSNAERLVDQSKLRELFPVSSGSLHRNKVEDGWVAVKKDEKIDEKVFPEQNPALNISELVSSRISAMRKLQDDPADSEAIVALSSSQKFMQNWALSKQVPGQFTGTTGARMLSQDELAAGHQAWARKEQFREANPVSSHFGLKMLQKMGWNPGEGLGKHKEGTIEPLLLDVKMDKKGLHAQEEVTSRKVPIPLAKNLAGKHPVSALVELCSKRKWNPPEFQIIFDSGPDHKKNFLMKVIVNRKEYKPAIATSTKKIAKANAAAACLEALGVLPKESLPVMKMQPSTIPSPFLINPENGMTIEEMQKMPPSLIPTPAGVPPQRWL